MTTPRRRAITLLLLLGWAFTNCFELPAGTGEPVELRLVPRDGAFFATVRLADVWNSEVAKPFRPLVQLQAGKALQDFEKSLGLTLGDIERLSVVVPSAEEGEPKWVVVATALKPFDRGKIIATLAPDGVETKRKGRAYHTTALVPDGVLHFFNERTVLFGPQAPVEDLLERAGKAKAGPLAEAVTLAGKNHAVVVGFDFAPVRKQVPANMPLEAQRFLPLLAINHGSVTEDFKDGLQTTVRLHFAGNNQAKAGEAAVKDLLDLGRQGLKQLAKDLPADAKANPEVQQFLKQADAWLAGVPVRVDGSTLVVSPRLKKEEPAVAMSMVLPAVQKVREAANRMNSQNNLKWIGLAMHNFHDTYGHLPPPAIYGKDGKPLLSWRVAILPFIEQDALSKEFKLDEPWDSPHNKKLLARMPNTYIHPAAPTKEPYTTYYQVFTGKDALFIGRNKLRLGPDVPDGVSNTLLAVEAAEAVPWTKPEDLVYDTKKPLPKLGTIFPAGTNVLFCDGSVRFLSRTVSEKVLRALITPRGGEVITQNDF